VVVQCNVHTNVLHECLVTSVDYYTATEAPVLTIAPLEICVRMLYAAEYSLSGTAPW
jgi:hypothetical protein